MILNFSCAININAKNKRCFDNDNLFSILTEEIERTKADNESRKKGKVALQPVDEVIDAVESGPLVESAPEWNYPEDESMIEQQQQSVDLFAENEFDFQPEPNDDKRNGDKELSTSLVQKADETENVTKIKELEREKEDLQQRLFDAKNALSEYSAKLDDQVSKCINQCTVMRSSAIRCNVTLMLCNAM